MEKVPNYGSMTIPQLKAELEKRPGALLSGRKEVLIARLESWDRNSNFGRPSTSQPRQMVVMQTPDVKEYRDLLSNHTVPSISHHAVKTFLEPQKVKLRRGKALYENKYVLSVRHCEQPAG